MIAKFAKAQGCKVGIAYRPEDDGEPTLVIDFPAGQSHWSIRQSDLFLLEEVAGVSAMPDVTVDRLESLKRAIAFKPRTARKRPAKKEPLQ